MTINTYKLLFAIVVVVGAFVAILTDELSNDAGWALIGTVCGYVLGNGIQARNGADVPGIIRPKPAGRRAEDPEEGTS